MNTVNKLIKTALGEVGYCEKASNSRLDSKSANVGFNDWNKYARDLDEKYPNFLNGKKNGGKGYWWCAIFVVWCFIKAFGEKSAHKLLCQPEKGLGASCTACANYYKKAGRWHERTETPKKGDQIIFQSNGSPCHTGIVYRVDKTYVYTVEGNTTADNSLNANGGCVAKKKYPLTSTYIYGYGRPDYDVKKKKPVLDKTGFCLGKNTTGVYALKQMLITAQRLGIISTKVGENSHFTRTTKKAVNEVLTKLGFSKNGIAGKRFIAKLGRLIREEVAR